MRIAFLTPEFITELVDGGGLGNYLNRMTQALRAEGHEPEVFVLSQKRPETIDFRGVPVHRVAPAIRHLAIRVAYRLCRQLGTGHLNDAIYLASGALGLAKALRRRERGAPFDLVQSADYLAVGLFVGHRRGRPHLIRCSWAADLYAAANGVQRRWETWLELVSIRRRADVAYAPSRLVADHYRRTYGFDLRVLRPPIFLEETAHASPPPGLPNRFLFHFGQLTSLKGTAWLAEALPLAWAQEPELTIVCAGPFYNPKDQEGWTSTWGPQRDRVVWLGPLPKPQLYTVLRRAEAAVLPSLVDNLPNTVLESLMFGIPVIGSAGASIDELVEPGKNRRAGANRRYPSPGRCLGSHVAGSVCGPQGIPLAVAHFPRDATGHCREEPPGTSPIPRCRSYNAERYPISNSLSSTMAPRMGR